MAITKLLSGMGGISREAAQGLVYMLWPGVCDNCGVSVSPDCDGLCQGCWQDLLKSCGGDYCRRCGRDVSSYGQLGGRCVICEEMQMSFDAIVRGGVYDGSLREMILKFKFNDRTELKSHLGRLVSSAFEGSEFRERVDYFVPVPLHWRRRLERGYNQSVLLCRGISQSKGIINTDLVRSRYTARQWLLSPAGRKRNVAGAFAVRRGHDFSGKNVCLVDDISTTWATLNECAKTLKDAGANEVFSVVAAIALRDMR